MINLRDRMDGTTGYLQVLVMIAGIYAVGTYLHGLLKTVLAGPAFCDFAHYYFFADLLNQDINFLNLDQQTIDALKERFPVKVCGGVAGLAVYSPVFYAGMMMLARLDFSVASIIWLVLNHTAVVLSILMLMRMTGFAFSAVNLSLASFLVFTFQPFMEDTALGQANILILFMLVSTLWAMMSSKHILAGLFISLAVLVKPHYGLIVLLLLIKRLYAPFLATLFSFAFLLVISSYITGADFVFAYFRGLMKAAALTWQGLTWMGNESLVAAAARLLRGQHQDILRIVYVFFDVGVILSAVRLFREKTAKELFPIEFSLMLLFVLIMSPMLEIHYLVMLFIPVFVVYSRLDVLRSPWPGLFIAGFILIAVKYSLLQFEVFHGGVISLLANGRLYGLIILLLVTMHTYRVSKKRTRVLSR